MPMKSISASTFRAHLRRYLDEVSEDDETLVIPRNRSAEDAVVVMSIAQYNSLRETEHLLSTDANRASLRRALGELERGEVTEVSID